MFSFPIFGQDLCLYQPIQIHVHVDAPVIVIIIHYIHSMDAALYYMSMSISCLICRILSINEKAAQRGRHVLIIIY